MLSTTDKCGCVAGSGRGSPGSSSDEWPFVVAPPTSAETTAATSLVVRGGDVRGNEGPCKLALGDTREPERLRGSRDGLCSSNADANEDVEILANVGRAGEAASDAALLEDVLTLSGDPMLVTPCMSSEDCPKG